MDMFRHLGDRLGQARALDELGLVQQLTGDYPAATANAAEAIKLFRDLGSRHDLAMALNSLGELSLQTSPPQDALSHHSEALAIARELGAPLEEARALEGIGRGLVLTRKVALHGGWRRTGASSSSADPGCQPGHGAPFRSVCPPRGQAPTVVLDKGDAVRSSGRAVKQSLSVQHGP